MALPPNLPQFGALPKVDPAATNALDNTPDVNMPDATGSVSGSFDFITAFFNEFVKLLNPPLVSDEEKAELERIANDSSSTTAEKEAARNQLNAANMANAFSSPLVRLAILSYIVIVILQILRRIPGVSGVPSVSSMTNSLFRTGSFTWTDKVQIVDGYFTLNNVYTVDSTYIKYKTNNYNATYSNIHGAEVAEYDKSNEKNYPQYYISYDGGVRRFVIPVFPQSLLEDSWFRGIVFKANFVAYYYLKFVSGEINIGTVEQPKYYELSSVRDVTNCEPLLLDSNLSPVQKATGRQVKAKVTQKIRRASVESTKISVEKVVTDNDQYTESVGELKFMKKPELIGDSLETTDIMDVLDISFQDGQTLFGWDIEEVTNTINYGLKHPVSFVIEEWEYHSGNDSYSPEFPNGNTFAWIESEQQQIGWKVVRMMLGGLKRADGKHRPLYEKEIPYTARYVELWVVLANNYPNGDPYLNIITIEDEDGVGSLFLGSDEKQFKKSGLNNAANIYHDTSSGSPRWYLQGAKSLFHDAQTTTDPYTFWSYFSSTRPKLEAIQYSGINERFSVQVEYFNKKVNELYNQVSEYYGSRYPRDTVTVEDTAKAAEFETLCQTLDDLSEQTYSILDNEYTNMDDSDGPNMSLEDGVYYNDKLDQCTSVKHYRWTRSGSSVQEKQQYWKELYAIIMASENLPYTPGVEYMNNTSWAQYKEELGAPERVAAQLMGSDRVHFIGAKHGIFGYTWPMSGHYEGSTYVKPDYGPDMKYRRVIFENGSAVINSYIGIDSIGDNYPPSVVVQDVPELVFEAQDPCTQPQSDMAKKMAMLVENDADQFTVMAAFGCCYTDDLWDKFLELKKAKRHMVRW